MNCLNKLVKFLNEYDIPDALVKAFKDDCQNLEDCLDKDCFPVITTPKENNKFLSLINKDTKSEYICEEEEEERWEKHICQYLFSKSRDLAKYYYNKKDYKTLLDLLTFNSYLAIEYPDYLIPSIFSRIKDIKYILIPSLSHDFIHFKYDIDEIELDERTAKYLTEIIEIIYQRSKGYKEPDLVQKIQILPSTYYFLINKLAKYPEIAKNIDYVIEEMIRHKQINFDQWRFCQYFASLIYTYKRIRYIKDLLEITLNAGGIPGWWCFSDFIDSTPPEILAKVDYIENLAEKIIKIRSHKRPAVYSFMLGYIKSLYETHPEIAKKYLDKYLEDILEDCHFIWSHPEFLEKLNEEEK